MKKLITVLLMLMMTLVLAACGSKTYQITTKTGKTFVADGALDYDVQSETYKFKDPQGREVILNQEEVEIIQEQKK